MQQLFHLIIVVLLHALYLLRPVFSLPTTLVRRVEVGGLEPQIYPRYRDTPYQPTFYAKEMCPPRSQPTRPEIDRAAEHACSLIRRHRLEPPSSTHFPNNMVVAALYVPRRNSIYYASQPIGAGYSFYRDLRGPHLWPGKNAGWPGPLSEQESMHAEGHAIYKAFNEGATASDFQGSYVGVYGHFNKGIGQRIPPCKGNVDNMTHCNALLSSLKIAHS